MKRASRLGPPRAGTRFTANRRVTWIERPWGERSFDVVDPWGNDLCFCQDGTLFT